MTHETLAMARKHFPHAMPLEDGRIELLRISVPAAEYGLSVIVAGDLPYLPGWQKEVQREIELSRERGRS